MTDKQLVTVDSDLLIEVAQELRWLAHYRFERLTENSTSDRYCKMSYEEQCRYGDKSAYELSLKLEAAVGSINEPMVGPKEEIEKAFKADLQALIDKYDGELEAKDYATGFPECSEDVHMTAYINGVYDKDGNILREHFEINLGANILPSPKE